MRNISTTRDCFISRKSLLLVLHLHLALREGRRTILNYPRASHNALWSTKPVRSGEKPSVPVLALSFNDEMLSSCDKSAVTAASTQQSNPARSYRLTDQLKTTQVQLVFPGALDFRLRDAVTLRKVTRKTQKAAMMDDSHELTT